MVQQHSQDRSAALGRAFSVPADPARRSILTRLGAGSATLRELTEPTGMTLTGMTKHVQILEDAGLVTSRKVGRMRQCRLGEEHLDDAMARIGFDQCRWERRLDGLDAYLTLRKGMDA